MKRLIATLLIFFLLGVTGLPLLPLSGDSYITYAAEETGTLDNQQKAALAISTYMNYRKGFFVGSSASAVSLMKSYIDEFFISSSNNTGINSYSEFADNIDVSKDSSGHWKVTIDNPGIVFLDHLVKYLLGKNKFPNLYSGGSWGSGATVDTAYRGLSYEGELFFYINDSSISYSNVTVVPESKVNPGTIVNGQSTEIIVDAFINSGKSTQPVLFDSSYASRGGYQSNQYNYTIRYYPDTTDTYYLTYSRNNFYSTSFSIDGYCPYLSCRTFSGLNGFKAGLVYSSHGGYGIPCRYAFAQNASTITYYGNVYYDGTNYYFGNIGSKSRSNTPSVANSQLDLNTNGFSHEDVGQSDNSGQPVPDAPSQTFTPQYTDDDGDTYNYYNNETVNNFYNDYISNYTYNTNNTYNSTVINNNSSGEDPDPDEPSGGTTPPWTDNGSAGTLTPNGNGGYDLSLPDLTLPDLDIDWSINGLKDKFPFSIPWDLMAFFTVLNAEPETPHFEGTIPIGIWEWEIDWDLHYFDNLAILVRNLEFIAFCIGLIIVTRNIIKG